MANSSVLLTDRTKLAIGAFRVGLNANQSITEDTQTKIQLDNIDYDTDGWFDDVTNFRYTPQQLGKYAISCVTDWPGITDIESQRVLILRNGVIIARTIDQQDASGFEVGGQSLYTEAEMNGSTDFIEFFVQQNNAGGSAENLQATVTFATGHLIGE